METNVYVELDKRLVDIVKRMRKTVKFWQENKELLKFGNEDENYPYSETFIDLTENVRKYCLTLISDQQIEDENYFFVILNLMKQIYNK